MPVGNSATATRPGSRLRELGLVLPKSPSPLGAYVEASQNVETVFEIEPPEHEAQEETHEVVR
jgi:hypothetical protein